MRKWRTANTRGFEPIEVDKEVTRMEDIRESGVYAVQGIDSPVFADQATSFGFSEIQKQNPEARYIHGLACYTAGEFVEDEK